MKKNGSKKKVSYRPRVGGRKSNVDKSGSGELVERLDEGGGEVIATTFIGPIPPPEVLLQYNELLPGSADRILAMAEQESAHRRSIESASLEADVQSSCREHIHRMRGQLFAFILAISAIVGGVGLAFAGVKGWGALLSLAGVATLVWPFLSGRMKPASSKGQKN